MSGPVGWYLDNESWIVHPVAAIDQGGDPMQVRFFERKRGGQIKTGKKEKIAEKDFFGAPVFIFSQIDGAEEWLIDLVQLTIRPVIEVKNNLRRPQEKKCALLLPRGQVERVTILTDDKLRLLVVHSDAFRRLIAEIEENLE